MKLCVNTLLGLGVQALAEAIALGEKSGLPRERLVQVLSETAVVSPSQKSKLENARKDEYPAAFPLRLMLKDFGLILETATQLSVPMPATDAAARVAAAEHDRQVAAHRDDDFSVVIRAMERMAAVAV
jgi:3-hydroxyisobutyrate dehydrogenase-like beta-hydroxyacid dehydrogenase